MLAEIDKLNNDKSVHGILVQLPLPDQVDKNKVLEAISPDKDVDGFHPINMGRIVAQEESMVPATPSGIIEMLKRENITMKGANATIVAIIDRVNINK